MNKFVCVFIFFSSFVILDDVAYCTSQKLKGITSADWVQYSADSKKLAVVRVKNDIARGQYGYGLEVFEVNTALQPNRLLFESKRNNERIFDFQWVEQQLYFASLRPRAQKKLNSGLEKQSKNVESEVIFSCWPSIYIPDKEISKIKISLSGSLFAYKGSNTLLIFDPFDTIQKMQRKSGEEFSTHRVVRIYNSRQKKVEKDVRAKLPELSSRWLRYDNKFIPLFVSEKSNSLYILATSASAIEGTSLPVIESILSIDLKSGNMKPITPQDRLNSLLLPNYPRYFEIGNPCLVDNNAHIICQLSLTEAPSTLLYRFGTFGLDGKAIRENYIFVKDVVKAGISTLSVIVTWTKLSHKVIIQDTKGVWLYDTETKKAKQVASNLLVKEVHGWVDSTHLLVKAISTNEIRGFANRALDWYILAIPNT